MNATLLSFIITSERSGEGEGGRGEAECETRGVSLNSSGRVMPAVSTRLGFV